MTAKAWIVAAALTLAPGAGSLAQDTPLEEQPPGVEQPAQEQPSAQEAQPEAKPAVPPQLAQYLEDDRSARDLSDNDLKVRVRRGQALLKWTSIPEGQRSEIGKRVARAKAELDRRATAQNEPAQEPTTEQPAPEKKKAEQPAEPPAANLPPAVAEFLGDTRPSKTLSEADLQDRIARARDLIRQESVPGDARVELRRRLARAQAELDRRGAATNQPPAQAESPPAAPAPAEQAGDPPRADVAILTDERPASGLSDDELKARINVADRVVHGDYRQQWRRAARKLADADRAELQRRAAAQAPAGQPSGADQKLLADNRPSNALSDEELKARHAAAERVVRGDFPLQLRRGARKIFDADAAEMQRRTKTAETPPGDGNLDGNPVSQAAEATAREFLAGADRANSLSDDQLGQRLAAMRDLLQRNELSPRTERALRQRLAEEREVLRTRVARREAEQEDAAAPRKPGRKRKIDFDTNITIVLGDRRRADELEDEELRRRIDVYREAMDDEDYSADERDYWRRTISEDRRALRGRLLRERDERARDYRRRQASNDDFDIEFDARAPRRDSVWAAEANDEDIEDALVAAPKRKIERRYTIDDIERDEGVRAQMPALEIDTVKFGFNEAFLREEEIAHLDRIAEVIEKILAARPNEVFLIEGHTDAVGSDAYNIDLSRKRARAVKEALNAYYVIPAKSLETAGYGERYLKIPTPDPEPENRRVSLRRVTPLVGER